MAKEVKGKKKENSKAMGKAGNLVEHSPDEIIKTIIELSKSGMTAAEIGMVLRDSYGVPSVKKLTGKRIEQILGEKGLLPDMPRDLLNLIRKSVFLYRHMKANKHDATAKRGYILTVSKIRRLTNYYIKAGKLDKDWRYTPEAAELLVK
jgi:ribosomal protein S15P/S13E